MARKLCLLPNAFDELLLLDCKDSSRRRPGANYCVHGRPELMGHVGEERRLGTVAASAAFGPAPALRSSQ